MRYKNSTGKASRAEHSRSAKPDLAKRETEIVAGGLAGTDSKVAKPIKKIEREGVKVDLFTPSFHREKRSRKMRYKTPSTLEVPLTEELTKFQFC